MSNREQYISNSVDNILDDILAIKYDYFITDIFLNTEKDEYVNMINKYLKSIVKNGNLSKIKKLQTVANNEQNDLSYNYFTDILSFFKNHEIDDDIQCEAESVVWELCYKVFGYNNRKVELPISVSDFENYFINYYIVDRNVNYLYMYIIIMLAIINKIIKK